MWDSKQLQIYFHNIKVAQQVSDSVLMHFRLLIHYNIFFSNLINFYIK